MTCFSASYFITVNTRPGSASLEFGSVLNCPINMDISASLAAVGDTALWHAYASGMERTLNGENTLTVTEMSDIQN